MGLGLEPTRAVARTWPQVWRELRSRPMGVAAALFVTGVVLHRATPQAAGVFVAIAGALVGVALLAIGTSRRAGVVVADAALGMALVLAGMAAGQLQASRYPARHIVHFTASERRLARLELRIADQPRLLNTLNPSPRRPVRQAVRAEALRILTTDAGAGWSEVEGSVLLHLDEPVAGLAVQQRVEVLAYLARPTPADNPGEFDWSAYYRDDRVLASVSAQHAGNVRILDDPGATPVQRLRAGARRLLAAGFDEARAGDHALLRALVLGDNDPMLRDVQDAFMRTGTSHHLAISGAHVAMVGFFVYGLCRMLRARPRAAVLIGLAAVFLYGTVVLPSPPVLRSVAVCIALGVGRLFKRHVDAVNLLSLSAVILLAHDPLDLYRPGFQLSYGTVLGLLVLTPRAVAWLESMRDVHDVVAESFRPPTRGRRFRRWLRRLLRDAGVAAVVAFLVATPLVLLHFNQLNPYAIAGSLLLIIPVALALLAGLLKIALTLLMPWWAGALAWGAAWPVASMRWTVEALAKLPGSDVAVAAPPAWSLWLGYALLALPMLPVPGSGRRAVRMLLRSGPALALLVPVAAAAWATARSGAPAGALRLTLLSVGSGQCAVVHLPSGGVALFDAGSSDRSEVHRRTLGPYLKQLGRPGIEAVFVSHANADHFNAAIDAIDAAGARRVYLAAPFAAHAAESPEARAFLRELAERGIAPIVLSSAGPTVRLDPAATVETLWPPDDAARLSPNDASLVLKLTCHGRTILFTGDVQDEAMRGLLSGGGARDLHCDVLVAPHHGSSESATGDLLDAAAPTHVLASNDATLSRKQQRLDALAAERGRTVLRTHEAGAITVDLLPVGEVRVSTFKPLRKDRPPAPPAAPRATPAR